MNRMRRTLALLAAALMAGCCGCARGDSQESVPVQTTLSAETTLSSAISSHTASQTAASQTASSETSHTETAAPSKSYEEAKKVLKDFLSAAAKGDADALIESSDIREWADCEVEAARQSDELGDVSEEDLREMLKGEFAAAFFGVFEDYEITGRPSPAQIPETARPEKVTSAVQKADAYTGYLIQGLAQRANAVGERVDFEVTETLSGGDTARETLRVSEEDGQWRVNLTDTVLRNTAALVFEGDS